MMSKSDLISRRDYGHVSMIQKMSFSVIAHCYAPWIKPKGIPHHFEWYIAYAQTQGAITLLEEVDHHGSVGRSLSTLWNCPCRTDATGTALS
jgi:hypothetical protein